MCLFPHFNGWVHSRYVLLLPWRSLVEVTGLPDSVTIQQKDRSLLKKNCKDCLTNKPSFLLNGEAIWKASVILLLKSSMVCCNTGKLFFWELDRGRIISIITYKIWSNDFAITLIDTTTYLYLRRPVGKVVHLQSTHKRESNTQRAYFNCTFYCSSNNTCDPYDHVLEL